ncbi:hypothetical protein A1O7_06546 [Cladophialophora yegresii CBS 114405]|uniref:Uncharacterized protein n=1 Tax=Cladophialophora yegresii CBS 114405 TaxID=1182544 RepID=W9W292_9EURO|nr:uncharacterized protein A1O7_06546 [Cladophialophora yegresii CBS 114405]EXJ59115.1 hypothetical protein A1O7_06546 [Cladophialophora yegresii CBS 114405]
MGRNKKAPKFPRAAQVQRANNALFSYGMDSGSSSDPESPPLPPGGPSAAPADRSPSPPSPVPGIDCATIESATQTILDEFAFDEGKRIFDSEEAGDPVFVAMFKAAFLDEDTETGKKTWRVDVDILGVLAEACRNSPGLENLKLLENPETGRQYLSGTTEAGALESIRTFALNCARAELPSLPDKPDFTEDPLHDSVQTFVYLGLIAIRAFIRNRHRLNQKINPLYLFERARASSMADEPNFFTFGEMGEIYDPQAIALEKSKKKSRKRAAKKAAAKAKENEKNNTEVAEGDTAVEASSSDPADAATASNEAVSAQIASASNEAAVTTPAPASREAAITNPAPTLTAPSGLDPDNPLVAMEMATQALSMYGARPPPGLSQYLGTPIRPRAARPASARNTEPRNLADATSLADPADTPTPPRRPRRDGRRRPAAGALTSTAAAGAGPATGTEEATESIMTPLPESQKHSRNETIEEYQRRTAPPVAPAPTEYRVHPVNNEEFVITGFGPQSFTAAVRDIAGAVTSGVRPDDPAAIARTMMGAQASLPATAVTPDATEADFASIARAIMAGQAPPPRGAFLGRSNISDEEIRDAMTLVGDSSAGAHTTSRTVAGPSRLPGQARQTAVPHLPDVPHPGAASRLPTQPRQPAASRLPETPRPGAASRRQGPPPLQTAASSRAMQRLYDAIGVELDAVHGMDPVARRAALAQAQQRLLRSETLAAARRDMPLRPTATAATQAALQEGRDDALNAAEEQRRAERARATRARPTRGPNATNTRAREQGYSFDIGGMRGYLGELEAMQIDGLRDPRVAAEHERRQAERMRGVRERRAAAVQDIIDRSAQIDREAEEESHRAMAALEEKEKKEKEEREAARKAADEAKKAEKKAKIAAKRAERKAKK